jgi:probable HAF family extracellular repeat protein
VTPVGINDAGQIIGTGTFYGNPRAFLATPIN